MSEQTMVYNGWNLLDKVLLVCRQADKDNIYQAYLCDPSNKKQVENARSWYSYWDYGEYDKTTHSYPNKKRVNGVEFELDNQGFEFQLYDSAGGSSQGGKLSFWNCLVSKDDKTFKIGINSELLLYLLRSSTFINGKCQEKVCFARCHGGVGVLHSGMKEYQLALQDMEKKQQVKKKTSKHIIGRNYITLTENNIYLGDFYQWYEPVYEGRELWRGNRAFSGYRKLQKPITVKLFPDTKEYTSTKEYCEWLKSRGLYSWNFREKLPARMEGDMSLTLNATNEDWEEVFKQYRLDTLNHRYCEFYLENTLSTNPNQAFDFEEKLVKHFEKIGIKVYE